MIPYFEYTRFVNLKDVANFYLGSLICYDDGISKWQGRILSYNPNSTLLLCANDEDSDYVLEKELNSLSKNESIKVYLKSVLNMPSHELKYYKGLCKKIIISEVKYKLVDTPLSILFLIQNGYDAFELIDNNFAIES